MGERCLELMYIGNQMRRLFLAFPLFACFGAAQPAAEKHLQQGIALHQSGDFEAAIRELLREA